MLCPACQHTNSRVLESRPTEEKQSIRRRRECLVCGHRFTTYERVEFVPIMVIKRGGHRELFDRSKVLRGIVRACEKTGIASTRLEEIVYNIEAKIQERVEREISTQEIGEMVLAHLRRVNEVAYVRFASVYRKFQGIKDFIETLNQLQASIISDESLFDSESDLLESNAPSCVTG